jgi:hypothetical protein
MATKGTKYSDVNFSVPEGADPMGIGVFDTGKSSYDPLQTIRSGWEKTRQERMIKDEREREDYQNYVNKLPTFDAFNEKLSSDLNSKVGKMKEYAEQKYKAGIFSPFLKTERGPEGKKVNDELKRMEKEIMNIAPFYEKAANVYNQSMAVAKDINNRDLINRKLTFQNLKKIADAETPEQLAEAISQNPVVFKPTPIDMLKYFNEQFDTLVSPADKELLDIKTDPKTGLIISTTGLGENKARNAGMQIFRTAMRDDNKKQWITEKYQQAKESGLTKDASGMDMDMQEWYLKEHMPQLAITSDVRNPVKDSTSGTGKKKKLTVINKGKYFEVKTGPEAISVPGEIKGLDEKGKDITISSQNALLSGFGYGPMPDGSIGKYAKLTIVEGSGDEKESIEITTPYSEYQQVIKDNYVVPGLKDIEAGEDVIAPVTYSATKTMEKRKKGLFGSEEVPIYELKDRNGRPAKAEEQIEFKNFVQSEGLEDVGYAADIYSKIKTFMRDNNIRNFEQGKKLYKESLSKGKKADDSVYNEKQKQFLNSIK